MSPSKRRSLRLSAAAKNASSAGGQSPSSLNKIGVNQISVITGGRARRKKVQRLRKALKKLVEESTLSCQSPNKREKIKKSESINTTIDLCMDDSSVIVENSAVCKIETPKNVVDINKEPSQKEVIDLTGIKKTDENLEPTVIDLSQEEESKRNQDNDDVLVIGTYSKTSFKDTSGARKSLRNRLPDFIPLTCQSNALKTLINFSDKLTKKNKRTNKESVNKFCNKKYLESLVPDPQLAAVGENISIDAPVPIPTKGLRPVIIDGSNVGFVNKAPSNFSSKRLEICIKYFKEKGHKVTAFLPEFRKQFNKSDNPQILKELEKQGDLIFTPSKRIDGRNIVPYDDRFIVQTAVLKGGVIVSRDNYNDLLKENPAWSDTIKYRTLSFTWVDDVLMFPKDPLGEYGPCLKDFLQF